MMSSRHLAATLLALIGTVPAMAPAMESTAKITVAHESHEKRPAEVVAIPFADVLRVLPDARMYHLQVRDAGGNIIPSQITNYEHDHRGFRYDDLVFQYDLPADSPAVFTLQTIAATTAPIAPRVFARLVPERYDDFAWENDRIAHRAYGPALNTAGAGVERLRGSGIDIWGKRVPFLVVDRWYLKGHDQFHKDGEGEGLDLYSIGGSRGAGGTGIWRNGKLFTSDNFASARVLANGPLRAVFELTYAPWDIGDGQTVTETKRFTVEAGRNFDTMESVFTFAGSAELTVGLGITQHKGTPLEVTRDARQQWLNTWETSADGGLGIAVILAPGTSAAGYASEPVGSAGSSYGNELMLAKVRSGQPLKYWIGSGWDRSGQFATRAEWDRYVLGFVQRSQAPLQVKIEAVK